MDDYIDMDDGRGGDDKHRCGILVAIGLSVMLWVMAAIIVFAAWKIASGR